MSISSQENFYEVSTAPFFLGTLTSGLFPDKISHVAGGYIAGSLYAGYGNGDVIKRSCRLAIELLQFGAGAAGSICLSNGISHKNLHAFAVGAGIVLASSAMVSGVNYIARQCGIRPL